MEIKKVPKFLSVRFRVIQACCKWLESQDRGVYKYFKQMKDDVLAEKYEASDTEMIVLEKFIGNYMEMKLSNLFILDVCEPVMELISYFESEKVRIQDGHRKLVLLLHNILGKFMKNAGQEANNNTVVGEELLNVKFYQEACHKMKKYFSPSIRSTSLKALAVLSPKAWSSLDLDTLKKQ